MTAIIFWVLVTSSYPNGAPPTLEQMPSHDICEQKAQALFRRNYAWCVPLIVEKKP